MDIFKYPTNYAPTSTISISPSLSYNFEFTMNSITSKINWKENTNSENRNAKKLRNLFEEIGEYIVENKEVKSLPKDSRVFM